MLKDNEIEQILSKVVFNKDGLIVAIAQSAKTNEVLMQAWINKDALIETLKTSRVCYWSRSRQSLWRKGETSGNYQFLQDLRIDCDGDSLLLIVDQIGPACHTGANNCFYRSVALDQNKD